MSNKSIKINVAAYALADFLHICKCSDINELTFTKEDNDAYFVISENTIDKAYYKPQPNYAAQSTIVIKELDKGVKE